MTNEFTLTRFFTITNRELYHFFTESDLIAQWFYPEGMVLQIPLFEAKEGGNYLLEHTDEKGTYVTQGHIEQMVPGQSLKVFDEFIKGPDGKILEQKLSREMIFMSLGDGCDLAVHQWGFKTLELAHKWEAGWIDCLDRLQTLTQRAEIPQSSVKSGPRTLGMDPSI